MIRATPGTGRADGPAGEPPSALIGLRGRGDDRQEVGGVEAGAADEEAVDVGQLDQLGGVVGLDRAAVEDADAGGGLGIALGEDGADEGDRLLRLLGRRRATRADRPDRLVGDDDPVELLSVNRRQVGLELAAQNRLGLAGVALGLALADAEDRLQPGGERRRDLAGQRLVGLAEVLAALGVAEDHARRRRPRAASAPRPRR